MLEESIQEISPGELSALKRFASLERKLLSEYPLFVSNFDASVMQTLSGKSAYSRDMDISLFMASDGNKNVARCATLINPRYQKAKDEKVGFIGYFAAAPGYEAIVQAMLDRAEMRLKSHGITRIIAPYNGSPLLGYGVLVSGFDEEPIIGFGWNPPYYAAYFTQAGFQPTYPLLVYTTDFASPKFCAAVERAQSTTAFQVRTINKGRWRSDLEIFRELINEAFINEWEWYPANSDEFYEFFAAMKVHMDAGLMLIAEVQGKPAGVSIGIPNWNPLLRSAQGQLNLYTELLFLLRGGHYDGGGHVFAAVRPEYSGMGMGTSLVALVCHRYEELGLKRAFGYTINVDNLASRKMNERLGGIGRILYQVYDKIIT